MTNNKERMEATEHPATEQPATAKAEQLMTGQLTAEQLMTLQEAVQCFPVPVCLQTVTRWTKKGIKGVILESMLVGERRYTSQMAIDRFLRRLNTPSNPIERE